MEARPETRRGRWDVALTIAALAWSLALVLGSFVVPISSGEASGGYVAWGLIGLLSVFAVLAMFSLGLLVVPVALLLARGATSRGPPVRLPASPGRRGPRLSGTRRA